jgi:hypothetical protein
MVCCLPEDGGDDERGAGARDPYKRKPPGTAATAGCSQHTAEQCHCLPSPQTPLQLPQAANKFTISYKILCKNFLKSFKNVINCKYYFEGKLFNLRGWSEKFST